MSGCPVDHNASVAPDGAFTDFSDAMSYGDYLRLDLVLAAQQPASAEHNELLPLMFKTIAWPHSIKKVGLNQSFDWEHPAKNPVMFISTLTTGIQK